MSLWRLDGLQKTFGAHEAVAGVDLTVEAGDRLGIIGESGSGKTTLARVGLGLLPGDGGRITLLGEAVDGWSEARWRRARRQVQLLFQEPRAMLHPALPIGLILQESAWLHGHDDPQRAAQQVLDEVALGDRADALAHRLSGGELRRVGVAKVLLARPRLLVADEPTAGLDASLRASLIRLLLDNLGEQSGLVLISHDLPLVAFACDRVVVMKEGQIVDRFATAALTEPGRHPYTEQLLKAAGL